MSSNNWVDALSADDLPSDDVQGIAVAGRDIAIYTVGDAVYATDNICTHGHEIECPLHQGKFDIRNGQPTCDPVTEALRSYPVKIEGGRVFLQLD
jgi:naphthalene 1,2-dioxygenase system ferredoxin subunit